MLSTVPGLERPPGAQGHRHRDARQQIVDRVVKDANDNAAVLNNTQYMVNQQQYKPNWNIYPAAGRHRGGQRDARRRRLDAGVRRRPRRRTA